MIEDPGPTIFWDLFRSRCPGSAPVIFEIGACDGADSIRLSNLFPEATIYAFEPNPDMAGKLIAATDSNTKIKAVLNAVSEHCGPVTFYKSTNGNPGCSSLYRSSGKYDLIEPMPQAEISVESIRLDGFMDRLKLKQVDALWLDAQGSELSILKSLGDRIASVRGVWTEFFYDELYAGQPLLPELSGWLVGKGFSMVWKRDVVKDGTGKYWWGDAFFVNSKLT